jgi:ABC-type amino acid transport substrate-binding protein
LKPEAYGIAFPTESELVEQTNRALLELREDGTYDRFVAVYFS